VSAAHLGKSKNLKPERPDLQGAFTRRVARKNLSASVEPKIFGTKSLAVCGGGCGGRGKGNVASGEDGVDVDAHGVFDAAGVAAS